MHANAIRNIKIKSKKLLIRIKRQPEPILLIKKTIQTTKNLNKQTPKLPYNYHRWCQEFGGTHFNLMTFLLWNLQVVAYLKKA